MGRASSDFQRLVDARGEALRQLPFEQLARDDEPTQTVSVHGRDGTIAVIVDALESDQVRVVVQGFLDGRILKSFKTVALHGFRMDVAGNVSELEPDEFYGYD